jgi:hypothetical protein
MPQRRRARVRSPGPGGGPGQTPRQTPPLRRRRLHRPVTLRIRILAGVAHAMHAASVRLRAGLNRAGPKHSQTISTAGLSGHAPCSRVRARVLVMLMSPAGTSAPPAHGDIRIRILAGVAHAHARGIRQLSGRLQAGLQLQASSQSHARRREPCNPRRRRSGVAHASRPSAQPHTHVCVLAALGWASPAYPRPARSTMGRELI